jgi:predicted hotdog family 3-hydroxylacyl-ACP dehydratase
MLDGVFHVRVSSHEPRDATTMVQYRGSWFYIPDDDLETKSTFELLTQIIALHSAPPATSAPISYSIGK